MTPHIKDLMLDEVQLAEARLNYLQRAYYATKYQDYKHALYCLDMIDYDRETKQDAKTIYKAIKTAATIKLCNTKHTPSHEPEQN